MSDLVVPALGESISEAIISKWLKKVGEPIAVDEPVVDLETDKVSVQLPAPAKGVLAEQLFPEGATVTVGQVIGRLDDGVVVAAAAPHPPAATTTVTAAKAAASGGSPAPTPTTAAALAEAAPVTTRDKAPNLPPPSIATTAPAPSSMADSGPHLVPALSPSKRRAMREQESAPPA